MLSFLAGEDENEEMIWLEHVEGKVYYYKNKSINMYIYIYVYVHIIYTLVYILNLEQSQHSRSCVRLLQFGHPETVT